MVLAAGPNDDDEEEEGPSASSAGFFSGPIVPCRIHLKVVSYAHSRKTDVYLIIHFRDFVQ